MVIGFALSFGLILLISYLILDRIETNAPEGLVTEHYFTQGKTAILYFNYGFVLIVIGMCSVSIISAFMIQTHPIFYIASFLATIVLVFLASIVSNVYYDFINNTDVFASFINQFSAMYTVIMNLPLIMLVISVIVAIATYSRGGEYYA